MLKRCSKKKNSDNTIQSKEKTSNEILRAKGKN